MVSEMINGRFNLELIYSFLMSSEELQKQQAVSTEETPSDPNEAEKEVGMYSL